MIALPRTLRAPRARNNHREGMLTVSGAELEALATMTDHPATLPLLQRARISRNLAFLAAALRGGRDSAHQVARAGFDLLAEVQRRKPAVVREVLLHPRFGGWVTVCAVRAHGNGAAPEADPPVAHLASFAAAAAVQAGVEFDLELPQSGDAIVLPGLGCWTGPVAMSVRVRYDGKTAPLPDGYRWTPLRRLSAQLADRAVDVEFDDLPPTPSTWPDEPVNGPESRWEPRSDAEFQLWQHRFDAALELLGTVVPELAAPLSRGLRAVLPRSQETYSFVSATLTDSFGATAMLLPADAVKMAAGLLHEFQHSKLGALMEIRPLITMDGPADLPSPWRAEPRPASAVLHGVYAHVAVARLLRRAAATSTAPRRHITQPSLCADPVTQAAITACDTLLGSDRLTPAGRRFVILMRRTAATDSDGRPAAPIP